MNKKAITQKILTLIISVIIAIILIVAIASAIGPDKISSIVEQTISDWNPANLQP